jgi:hypothetical protein
MIARQQGLERPIAMVAIGGIMILVLGGLWMLSWPTNYSQRLKSLNEQSELADKAGMARGDLNAYPVGSVCSGQDQASLKELISRRVVDSGLKLEGLDMEDGFKVGEANPLLAYRYRFKASGSYEAAIMAMQSMNEMSPKLFLDNLVLRNRIDVVELEIEGRLFCRYTGPL